MEHTITINVAGMHCVNCAKTIETALLKVNGVRSARVAFANEKAVAVFDPAVTEVKALQKAIEDQGFRFLGVDGQVDRATLDEIKLHLLRAHVRKFSIGFIAGFALMAMGMMKSGLGMHARMIAQLIISTPVFLYISAPIFKAAFSSLLSRSLTMDVMYALGMGTAYVASVMATLGLFLSPQFMFFDTAVLLAAFLTLGRYLEMRARRHTSSAIRALLDLRPKTATMVEHGASREVPIEAVIAGDTLIVRPGEAIPVDGTILSGESFVDESMISGESFPVDKKKGDSVISGAINKNSVLTMVVVKTGNDTLLSQIIRLVQEAQNSRPPIQKIADRAVGWFIPLVLSIALITFMAWHFVFGSSLLFALSACISVLVVACPCALGLATPTALSVGLGRAAELGILIKNGDALELSEKISIVVFDKTGTLTDGAPSVTDIVPLLGDKRSLITLASSVERYSQHPLAKAIMQKAEELGCDFRNCGEFNTVEGKGVVGLIDGKETLVGSAALLAQRGIVLDSETEAALRQLTGDGKSVLLVSHDKRPAGLIACADALKISSQKAIRALHALHIDTIMMSGDHENTCRAIARQAGINTVFADLLPLVKAERVKRLQEGGGRVAFVGDGINDAVALAQADVGIALGAGTDVAIESAGMVLMHDDCMDVVAALQLSKAVMKRIRLNLFWAFAYNAALIPFAAGLAYPFFHVMVRPEWAGCAMAMSSMTVVMLSLLLKRYIPSVKKIRPTQ